MGPFKAGLAFAGLPELTSAVNGADVVVKMAPAPESLVVVGPVPNYAWIGGYHHWNGDRYVWVAGKSIVPPRAGAVWISPE